MRHGGNMLRSAGSVKLSAERRTSLRNGGFQPADRRLRFCSKSPETREKYEEDQARN